MGRPRLLLLIRHAQSEGNQNRQIHQTIPDHRVKLTPEGWDQAHEAGRKLRSMLRPEDTIQFYTSPYRRTRETTDGILQTLTEGGDGDDGEGEGGKTVFERKNIKVWEEPRLREQDFGNFQPSSADMETMWKERANYGHFFYRIPNGESAADAYDRVSGFNETLFRSFGEEDFPSVCVLVTHGLMTRVFLMRWYHWSVEYFEDLRNINHCEMVIMERSPSAGKFRLQTPLRTWSELRRQRALEKGEALNEVASPPVRRGWNNTDEEEAFPRVETEGEETDSPVEPPAKEGPVRRLSYMDNPAMRKSFKGSASGTATPIEMDGASDARDTYFGVPQQEPKADDDDDEVVGDLQGFKRDRNAMPTDEEKGRWEKESGMGSGARAERLGDARRGSEDGGEAKTLEEQERSDKSVGGSVY